MDLSTDAAHARRDSQLVMAAFVVALAMYWPTLARYHAVWSVQPNTHGYLVALGTGWLLWQERSAFAAHRAWGGPLVFVAALSVGWMFAHVASVQFLALAVLPLMAMAWCAAVFGRHTLRRLLPIGAVFMLAVPLWGVLTPALRALTIAVTTAVLRLLRVPAEIDGAIIHLDQGSFLIEDACAGFNYFMAGLAVGALYAVGLVRERRTRVRVLALAAGLSVAANWIRVTSLVLIGHLTRMEAAIIYDHGTYGWVVFTLFVLVAFFPIAGRLTRRESQDRGEAHRSDSSRSTIPAVEAAPTTPPSGFRTAARATAVAGLGPALYFGIGLITTPATDLGLEPAASGYSLQSAASPFDWSPAYRGEDERRRTVWAAGPRSVTVDRVLYRRQRQEAELIGLGNVIAPDSLVLSNRMLGPLGAERRIVNEAIIQERSSALLVWYWYRVGEIETASPLKAKLLEIPAFLRRRPLSELIAISTACAEGSCQEASKVLADFLGESRR